MSVRRFQGGYSIIELLISLVIGLLVVLGVTQVFTAAFRANTEAVLYTNLNEQLRAVSNAMSRDIRRAGFWRGSLGDVNTGVQNNPFIDIAAVDWPAADGDDPECFLFGYDRNNDGDGDDADDSADWRGFRFNEAENVIEVKTSGSDGDVADWDAPQPSDCDSGTWEDFIDPDVVSITDASFATTERRVIAADNCPDADSDLVIYVRETTINLRGELVADPNVSRTINDVIRLRNDRIETEAHAPAVCP